MERLELKVNAKNLPWKVLMSSSICCSYVVPIVRFSAESISFRVEQVSSHDLMIVFNSDTGSFARLKPNRILFESDLFVIFFCSG